MDSGFYRRGGMTLQALVTTLQAETITADPTVAGAPLDVTLYLRHWR
jgi:hypothetical protein